MRAAQAGDGASYECLLREMVPLLRRYVRWHERRWSEADLEDIVQDILLSVHVARATYDSRRPFRPWLLAIARNRTADAQRRHMRQSAHETVTDPLPETFSGAEPNLEGEMRAEVEIMKRAMSALSAKQRRALELLKLQELSLKDASAITGMSVPALQVTVHRAIRTLGSKLGRRSG